MSSVRCGVADTVHRQKTKQVVMTTGDAPIGPTMSVEIVTTHDRLIDCAVPVYGRHSVDC